MSELVIIHDGGMLIRDGAIEMIAPSDWIEKNSPRAEIVDAGGRVILPGFVDAHTHLVFAGDRLEDFEARARGESYEQIARRGGGIDDSQMVRQVATKIERTKRFGFAQGAGKRSRGLYLGDLIAQLLPFFGVQVADRVQRLQDPFQRLGNLVGMVGQVGGNLASAQ